MFIVDFIWWKWILFILKSELLSGLKYINWDYLIRHKCTRFVCQFIWVYCAVKVYEAVQSTHIVERLPSLSWWSQLLPCRFIILLAFKLTKVLTEWSFCVCLGFKTNSSFIHFWTVKELILLCLRPDYFALPSQQSAVTVCVTAWGPLTQWLWVKCRPTWQWTQYPVTVALRPPPATRSVALWPPSTLAQCSTQMVRNLQS